MHAMNMRIVSTYEIYNDILHCTETILLMRSIHIIENICLLYVILTMVRA